MKYEVENKSVALVDRSTTFDIDTLRAEVVLPTPATNLLVFIALPLL